MVEHDRIHRLSPVVFHTVTGSISAAVSVGAVIPITSAFALLEELAARTVFPNARATSTIAKGLRGVDAHLGLAMITGQIVGELRASDPWKQMVVAAALVVRMNKPDYRGSGLESLAASLANLLAGRVASRVLDDLVDAAVTHAAVSDYCQTSPMLIAASDGAVRSIPVGAGLTVDQDVLDEVRHHPIDEERNRIERDSLTKWQEALGEHGGSEAGTQLTHWFDEGWGSWAFDDLGGVGGSASAGSSGIGSLGSPVQSGTKNEGGVPSRRHPTGTDVFGNGSQMPVSHTQMVSDISSDEAMEVGEGLFIAAETLAPAAAAFGPAGEGVVQTAAAVGLVIWAVGAVVKAIEDANSVNPNADPTSGTPTIEVTKRIRVFLKARNGSGGRRPGLWPSDDPSMDGDQDAIAARGSGVRHFEIVDPLDDPLRMSFADGDDKSEVPPPVLDQGAVSWRRYANWAGPGGMALVKESGAYLSI